MTAGSLDEPVMFFAEPAQSGPDALGGSRRGRKYSPHDGSEGLARGGDTRRQCLPNRGNDANDQGVAHEERPFDVR